MAKTYRTALIIEGDAKGGVRAIKATDRELEKLSRQQKRTIATNKRMERSFRGVSHSMSGLSLAVGAVGYVAAMRQIIRASTAMQRIESSFRAATGSAEEGAAAFAFVEAEADRLGLSLQSVATEYSQFLAAAAATNLTTAQSREIFSGVAAASTALGLTAEQTAGAFNALQQMLSKGNVQAEEIRGQLGERIPGAFSIFARALGVTTQELNKMLQAGEVLAEDALPKFARELRETFGDDAIRASDNLQQNINRLQTAFFKITSSGNVDSLSASIGDLADTLNDPATRQGLQAMIQGFITLTGWAISATSSIASLTGFIGEEIASEIHGPALGDTVRVAEELGDEIERLKYLKEQLANVEGSSPSLRTAMQDEIDKQKAIVEQWRQKLELSRQLNSKTITLDPITVTGKGAPKNGSPVPGNAAPAAPSPMDLIRVDVPDRPEISTQHERDRAALDTIRQDLKSQEQILRESYARRRGIINRSLSERDDLRTKLLGRLDAQYAEQLAQFQGTQDQMSEYAVQASRNIQSAFADFLFDPFSDGLDGMLKGFANTLRRMAAEQSSSAILDSIGTAASNYGASNGGTWGSIASAIGSFFGGGKATGGPVSASQFYVVGEKGPELFAPRQSGTIIPNHALSPAANSPNVYVNITSNGPPIQAQQTTTRRAANGDIIVDAQIDQSLGRLAGQGKLEKHIRPYTGRGRVGDI